MSKHQAYRINAQELIISLLKRTSSARTALILRFNKDPGTYPSAIIEVNEQQRFLRLDEVVDPSAHRRISLGLGFQVEARLGGVHLHFSVSNASYLKDRDGHGLYHLALPSQLFYYQKRHHYRVPLSGSAFSLSARLKHNYQELIGIATDLSLTGVGFLTRDGIKLAFADQLERIRLDFRDQVLEVSEARIVFLHHFPEKGLLRVGCEFLDLPRATADEIKSKVRTLDRDQIRKY